MHIQIESVFSPAPVFGVSKHTSPAFLLQEVICGFLLYKESFNFKNYFSNVSHTWLKRQ